MQGVTLGDNSMPDVSRLESTIEKKQQFCLFFSLRSMLNLFLYRDFYIDDGAAILLKMLAIYGVEDKLENELTLPHMLRDSKSTLTRADVLQRHCDLP